jgi:eukaryotic-like serine/threonine-protein kinase
MKAEQISHYRIISKLGAGGMGEVYLAEDTKLGRKVALKLLPAEFTRDSARVRRFEHEARAASALNHPNIITIFEIGSEQGAHFIATEYIDGQTLRAHLHAGKLAPLAALDLALQLAAALAAAHEAGIIHRDLKPENVMLRRDGIVKVLDFGLAKLAEQRTEAVDSEAPTMAKVNTDPGTVMGTASYMSPEQARGQEVDARSDIFSLGVVLYEVVAGRPPFAGVNAFEVIGEILKTEPPPLNVHAPDAPAELQRIAMKALRKDREERYQHSKDLLLDLRDLKRELEFAVRAKAAQPAVERPVGGASDGQPAAATNEVAAARTTSSAEIIFGEIKRHKRGVLMAAAALALLVAGLAFGWYKLLNANSSKPAAPFQGMKLTRLTAHGQAVAAAISPDGKYVVYAKQESAGQSLWLRQVAVSNSDVRIAPPKETEYAFFAYSRDGNFIYYVEGRMGVASTALYRMSALGRNSTLLISNFNSPEVTLSPDGRRLAFMRNYAARMNELFVANADGSDQRVLAAGVKPRDLFRTAAWSPDGKSIACGLIFTDERESYQTVVAVNAETGAQQPLTTQRWSSVNQLHWLPDGSGLLVLASEYSGVFESAPAGQQLWRLSLPGGEAQRQTNDLNSYNSLSLTADPGILIALQKEAALNLWVAPKGDANRALQLPRMSKDDGARGLAWTPDGRIVFTSTVSGSNSLWLSDADGGNQKQLDAGPCQQPSVSGDGRSLIFLSSRTGNLNLWRMELGGGGLTQLTNEGLYGGNSCTPDGKWVVYVRRYNEKITLWKLPLEGGTPVQLTDQVAASPAVSPDGRLIAYTGRDEQGRRNIVVMPFAGGAATKTFELPLNMYVSAGQRWTPDGQMVSYVCTRSGVSNIYGQPLAGGAPKQLTDFKTEQIRAFDWSRDGQLTASRGVVNSDLVLISGIK